MVSGISGVKWWASGQKVVRSSLTTVKLLSCIKMLSTCYYFATIRLLITMPMLTFNLWKLICSSSVYLHTQLNVYAAALGVTVTISNSRVEVKFLKSRHVWMPRMNIIDIDIECRPCSPLSCISFVLTTSMPLLLNLWATDGCPKWIDMNFK